MSTDQERLKQLKRFGGDPRHTWRTRCVVCGAKLPPRSWKLLCDDCFSTATGVKQPEEKNQ